LVAKFERFSSKYSESCKQNSFGALMTNCSFFQSGGSLQENPESRLHYRGCKPLSTRSAATSAAFN